jgi:hypothetical protein
VPDARRFRLPEMDTYQNRTVSRNPSLNATNPLPQKSVLVGRTQFTYLKHFLPPFPLVAAGMFVYFRISVDGAEFLFSESRGVTMLPCVT